MLCGPAALESPENLLEMQDLENIHGPLLPSAAVKHQVQVYTGAVEPISISNQAEVKMQVVCKGLDGKKIRTHKIQSLYGVEEAVSGVFVQTAREEP